MIMVTAVCSIESIIPVCSIYKIKSVSSYKKAYMYSTHDKALNRFGVGLIGTSQLVPQS